MYKFPTRRNWLKHLLLVKKKAPRYMKSKERDTTITSSNVTRNH